MRIKLKNQVYDIGKYVTQVGLPSVATFYAAVGALWGFPNITEVVGTITATDTLLGGLLLISTAQFNKDREAKLEQLMNDPAAHQ